MSLFILTTLVMLINPAFALPLIVVGLLRSRQHPRLYGLLLSIIIGLVMYNVIPNKDMDLYRYYAYIDSLTHLNFGNGLKEIWRLGDPISYSLMYITAKIANKNSIMLAVSLLNYNILFYVIFDYCKQKGATLQNRAITLIYFLTTYNIVNSITGIRFSLAISIFVLGIYLEIIKQKKITGKILYLSTPLVHSSAITLILIRAAAALFKTSKSRLQFAIVFGVGISGTLLMYISGALSTVPFLGALSLRASVYLSPYFPPGYWYILNILSTIIILVLELSVWNEERTNEVLSRINIYVALIAMANMQNFYIASRLMGVSRVLFIFTLINLLTNQYFVKRLKSKPLSSALLITAAMICMFGFGLYQFQVLSSQNYAVSSQEALTNSLYKNTRSTK